MSDKWNITVEFSDYSKDISKDFTSIESATKVFEKIVQEDGKNFGKAWLRDSDGNVLDRCFVKERDTVEKAMPKK